MSIVKSNILWHPYRVKVKHMSKPQFMSDKSLKDLKEEYRIESHSFESLDCCRRSKIHRIINERSNELLKNTELLAEFLETSYEINMFTANSFDMDNPSKWAWFKLAELLILTQLDEKEIEERMKIAKEEII